MTIATATPAGYIAAYLMTAELVGSTSPFARAATVDEDVVERSYVSAPPWALQRIFVVESSATEPVPIWLGPARGEDVLLAELSAYGELDAEWDGEGAAKPRPGAIADAKHFVAAAGTRRLELEPSLHVDGSVILDVVDDAGSLRFRGDGKIVFALRDVGRGICDFDGVTVPGEIGPALGA